MSLVIGTEEDIHESAYLGISCKTCTHVTTSKTTCCIWNKTIVDHEVCPNWGRQELTLKDIGEQQYYISEQNNWHNKTPLEYLALICSEVGEACNECRGVQPTEKLGEELADIILRVCDFAKVQGINLNEQVINKVMINGVSGTKGRVK